MAKNISFLVGQKMLSREAAARLGTAWVQNVDELYSRARACENPEMRRGMEIELGIGEGELSDFMRQISEYVSPEVLNAPKPPRYPLGYRNYKRCRKFL